MENQNPSTEKKPQGYVPRPAWQVWAARVGLVLFIGVVIYFYLRIAGGAL